jgi:hypothetical protein
MLDLLTYLRDYEFSRSISNSKLTGKEYDMAAKIRQEAHGQRLNGKEMYMGDA